MPAKPQPAARTSAAQSPRGLVWSLVRISAGDGRRRREDGEHDRAPSQGAAQAAHPISSAIASPLSSPLVMKPRAGLSATASPKSAALAGRGEDDRGRLAERARSRAATSKPSRSGSCTSSRTRSGSSSRGGVDRGARRRPPRRPPRSRSPRASAARWPEARVVIDDQDGRGHSSIVLHRRALQGYGLATPLARRQPHPEDACQPHWNAACAMGSSGRSHPIPDREEPDATARRPTSQPAPHAGAPPTARSPSSGGSPSWSLSLADRRRGRPSS